jgi:acetyl coenzyme A synthetase (ADP forming)-like protein
VSEIAPDYPYPSDWECDVALSDGGTVHVRAIRPDDDAALLALYERMSEESLYLRFFSPVPPPSARQLDRLATVDHRERVALIAELGGDIVAVARYDCFPTGHEAEVAFIVDDKLQGRGIGTLLLEQLAAIGREEGITRFVATTLPQNRRMLDVFSDAGYTVTRTFSEGAVEVSFPIEVTEASLAVQQQREQHAEARSMGRLLAPTSIAVIGAGRRPNTIGHELFRNLLAGNFSGPVYPVNPSASSVASVRAYPSILDVPDQVDMAVITVPAADVLDVVEQCARKAVRGLVVITAGFAEIGGEHVSTEHELVEIVRRYGMRMVGPNCMGVINTNPAVQMNATFAPFAAPSGRVGFLSQSGGLGIELLGRASELGLGISTFVSVGNKADVSGNDLLQYWEEDPDTDVILMYLESFGNPRKFARLARRVSRAKPIVAMKSGRTGAGTRGASSHTAALASPDDTVDALFAQAGVIRVKTLEQLFGTAQLLAHQPLPPGRRVAIVSNGGGPGILAADACESAGLEVPELNADAQAELRSFVSPDASVRNPIDLVAAATATTYERTLRTLLAGDQIDALLAIFVPPLVTRAADVARAVATAAADAGDKTVLTCFLGRTGLPDALRGTGPSAGNATGHRAVPSFAFPEAAAAALGRAADHADWLRRDEGQVPAFDDVDIDAARALVDERMEFHVDGAWLDPDVAARLCDCFGVAVAPSVWVASASGALGVAEEIGYPVALKAGSGAIVHKTDVGAVHLDLDSSEAVTGAFEAMRTALGDEMGGAIVQPMVESGVETIVGVTHDPLFGSLVVFGMGGVAAELIRDRALRILPLTDVDAHELVRSVRSSPLLFGYRGAPEANVDALEQLLLRVGRLADAVPEVVEMDCNPVIVTPKGATVVDVKIRLGPPAPHRLPGVRRLHGT